MEEKDIINPYKTLDILLHDKDVFKGLVGVALLMGAGIAVGSAIISLPIYFLLGEPSYSTGPHSFSQIAGFFITCALLQALHYLVTVVPMSWHVTSRAITRREELRFLVETRYGMNVFAEGATWDQYAKHLLDFFAESKSANKAADLVGRITSSLYWILILLTGSVTFVPFVIFLVYQGSFDSAWLLGIFVLLRAAFYIIAALVVYMTKSLTGRYPSEPRKMRKAINSALESYSPPFEWLDQWARGQDFEEAAVSANFISPLTYKRWQEEAKLRLSAENEVDVGD